MKERDRLLSYKTVEVAGIANEARDIALAIVNEDWRGDILARRAELKLSIQRLKAEMSALLVLME